MLRSILALLATISLAFSGQASARDALKNSGSGTVESKVVIGSFTVAFYHLKKDKMKTFDGGRKSMQVALAGLTSDQLQRGTEVVYEQFREDLEASGITIKDSAELLGLLSADSKFKTLDQGHEVKMYFGRKKSEGKVLLFAPAEFGGPIANRDHEGLALMFRGFKMMSVMPRALHFEATTKKYAKDNKVAVINPLIVVDFADFDTYEGKYVRAVEAQSSLAVVGKESGVHQTSVQFYGANGKMGRIVLEDSMAVAGGFGRIEKDGGVPLGRLMGLSTKSNYAFTADSEQWATGMAELTTATTQMLAQAVAAR